MSIYDHLTSHYSQCAWTSVKIMLVFLWKRRIKQLHFEDNQTLKFPTAYSTPSTNITVKVACLFPNYYYNVAWDSHYVILFVFWLQERELHPKYFDRKISNPWIFNQRTSSIHLLHGMSSSLLCCILQKTNHFKVILCYFWIACGSKI